MSKYMVQWKYSSSLGGPYVKGDVIDIDDQQADAINRDSPGVLVKGKKTDAVPVDQKTVHDRQVKAAQTRGRSKGDPMTRGNFGAVARKESE